MATLPHPICQEKHNKPWTACVNQFKRGLYSDAIEEPSLPPGLGCPSTHQLVVNHLLRRTSHARTSTVVKPGPRGLTLRGQRVAQPFLSAMAVYHTCGKLPRTRHHPMKTFRGRLHVRHGRARGRRDRGWGTGDAPRRTTGSRRRHVTSQWPLSVSEPRKGRPRRSAISGSSTTLAHKEGLSLCEYSLPSDS